MIDEIQPSRDDQGLDFSPDRVADRIGKRISVPVQPPKDFRVERAGSALRLVAIDRGRFISAKGETSGADRYLFFWAESVDDTTKAGIDAGFARSTGVGSVLRAFIEDKELTVQLSDGKFQSGYFYVVGSNTLGDFSDFVFSGKQSSEIVDDTIPANVTDFTVSESGEMHNGVMVSAVSFQYDSPADSSFDGVLFFLVDYPNLGEVTEYYTDKFIGPSRGRSTGKFTALPCRRPGAGTVNMTAASAVVTGAATTFTTKFNVGDVLEIRGVQGTVLTVTDDTHMTLTAGWTGKTAGETDWLAIGQVTIYAVPLSKAGTHKPYTQAVSQRVLFDADDSAPLAPTMTASPTGNAIRIFLTLAAGSHLRSATIYRAKGASIAFSDPSITAVHTFTQDKVNSGTVLEFVDEDFLVYDRDNGQTFSYYADVTNERGMRGATSTVVNASCRLNSTQDGDPIASRDGFKNIAFNGFIGGAGVLISGTNNVVDDSDTSQDAFNFNPAIAPSTFTVASGTRLNAWTRWKYEQNGGATVFPVHINGNEVKLPPPGAVGKDVRIKQFISAWSAAAQADRKIYKGGYYTLQVEAYCDTTPNGSFFFGLAQYNAGIGTSALLRTRNSDDSISEASALLVSAGSNLTTSAQRFYAVYRLDPALTTDHIMIIVGHTDSTSGNIFVRKVCLNEGIVLGPWTGDMGNIDMSIPVTTNPGGRQGDPPGNDRGGRLTLLP